MGIAPSVPLRLWWPRRFSGFMRKYQRFWLARGRTHGSSINLAKLARTEGKNRHGILTLISLRPAVSAASWVTKMKDGRTYLEHKKSSRRSEDRGCVGGNPTGSREDTTTVVETLVQAGENVAVLMGTEAPGPETSSTSEGHPNLSLQNLQKILSCPSSNKCYFSSMIYPVTLDEWKTFDSSARKTVL